MSDNTIYLVTGANKGIGLALVEHLLQRPNTTVIATYRASSATSTSPFSGLKPDPSSTLISLPLTTLPIPSTSALRSLLPPAITHLDTIIANAGGTSGFRDVPSTSAEDMMYDFEVNAVGTAELFRVCWPLLEKSEKDTKKFVMVSSSVASIATLAEEKFPATAYGMSKAAANWWARKVSLDYREKGLAVGILHPGWVKTGMGQGIADALGIKGVGPGMTAWDSARALLEQIDNLTLQNSGEFKSYDGKPLPW